MSQREQTYLLSFKGPEGLTWKGPHQVMVTAGETNTVGVTLGYDPYYHNVATTPVWFTLQSQADPDVVKQHESRFISAQP